MAAARQVVLVRAIETTDRAHASWSDADRVWAGRASAEVVGAEASAETFLARRAALALERLTERAPALRHLQRGARRRAWLAAGTITVAFIAGAAADQIGAAHRINLLAPPLLALLVWNLAVYVALVLATVRGWLRRPTPEGPLRRTFARLLAGMAGLPRGAAAAPLLVAAVASFAVDWTRLAMPLWQARAARVLHAGAAAFALGAIAGLYARGIALEYRAGWESTFLGPAEVAGLLRFMLAPGSAITGIALPGPAGFEALMHGGTDMAAPWIHLYAATIAALVIVPRVILATIAGLRERRLARHFPLALDGPYYRRLLHAYREGAASVLVLPYSFEVPPASEAGLGAVLTRVFQSAIGLHLTRAVAYGEDDLPAVPELSPGAAPAAVIALFNFNATPESENHGAFVAALAERFGSMAPVIALVDTSQFLERFQAQPGRYSEREQTWRQVLGARGVQPIFVRLAAPDVTDAAAALTVLLDRDAP